MNDWLYPLSSTAGTWFEDPRTGKRETVSADSFRTMVLNTKSPDDQWYLTTNYRNVEPGDRIWAYTGNDDIGVIGVGKVVAIERSAPEKWITIRFDKAASKRLCANPYPAPKVRKYIPFPRGAVQNMDRHPALVRCQGPSRRQLVCERAVPCRPPRAIP